MGMMPTTESDERIFAALADPTRRELLSKLAENSPLTATQLKQVFPISRQGIMKHLDLLAEAGLVQTYTQGREKRYLLAPERLHSVTTWIEAIDAVWEERLQRLKAFVESDEDL